MGCLSEEYYVLRDSAQGVSEMRIALENRSIVFKSQLSGLLNICELLFSPFLSQKQK